MRFRIGVALLLLTAPAAFAQQRFASFKLNFSVQTPGPGWQWASAGDLEMNTRADGVWTVKAPNGESFLVSTSRKSSYRLTEPWMQGMERELAAEGARNHYRVTSFRYEPASFPIYPSYSYSYTRVDEHGTPSYVDGYIAVIDRVYTIQYVSRNRELLPQFRSFVDSFAVVDKFEAQRTSSTPQIGNNPTPFPGLAVLGLSNLGRTMAPNSAPVHGGPVGPPGGEQPDSAFGTH